ncbi:MAG TPA: DUF4198 domain-containing protein [Thermoanaerobaculia bacterium]|nr:DUF4198 domain-containing protein [Thermoanaerobaculia bacterium]
MRLLSTLALAATVVGSALVAAPAAAHDFWIEPSTYRPEPLQRVTLRHRVGNHFLGDPVPRDEGLMVRFATLGGDGEKRVPGVHGVDPAGIAQAPETGTLVVAYQSRGSVAELPPDKMARYAEEEGVASQLPAGWQRKALLRDSFSRSVKSLLVVHGRGSAGFDRVAGLPLELVPLVDPAGLAAGGALPVRLLWQGKPVAGIQVAALSRLDPSKALVARTDGDGRVTFTLPRTGEWLVKAVKILPPPDATADFASLWTSLTFVAGEP